MLKFTYSRCGRNLPKFAYFCMTMELNPIGEQARTGCWYIAIWCYIVTYSKYLWFLMVMVRSLCYSSIRFGRRWPKPYKIFLSDEAFYISVKKLTKIEKTFFMLQCKKNRKYSMKCLYFFNPLLIWWSISSPNYRGCNENSSAHSFYFDGNQRPGFFPQCAD